MNSPNGLVLTSLSVFSVVETTISTGMIVRNDSAISTTCRTARVARRRGETRFFTGPDERSRVGSA